MIDSLRDDFAVLAVANPLRGVEQDSAHLASVLEDTDTRVHPDRSRHLTSMENLMRTNVSAVFDERDPARRRGAIETTYTADASVHAAEGSSSGWDGVDAVVRGVLEGAGDMRFTVTARPSVVADVGRVSWELAAPGVPPVVRGTDVAIVREGKIDVRFTAEAQGWPAAPVRIGFGVQPPHRKTFLT